jgi:drug/metabolite transporter (DMT)-like permease
VLAAAVLFSTGGAAIKATALGAWQVAGLRSAFAAAFLWFALPAARRRPTFAALAVAAAYAATLILFVAGNKLTTAANTIFLQSTAPLWVLLLAPRLLGEPVRRRDLGFMAALAAGLAIFFVGAAEPSATAPDPRTGDLLAVGSGATWALTLLGLRALGRRTPAVAGVPPGRGAPAGVGGAQAVLLGNVLVLLVCLPGIAAVGGGGGLAAATATDWAVVAYLGVVQIGLAYALLTGALREVPALEAALLLLIEPVLNPVWAWLALGERPGAWSIAGGALILGATASKSWLDARSLGRLRRSATPGAGGG